MTSANLHVQSDERKRVLQSTIEVDGTHEHTESVVKTIGRNDDVDGKREVSETEIKTCELHASTVASENDNVKSHL